MIWSQRQTAEPPARTLPGEVQPDEDSLRMVRVAEGDERALAELIERWQVPLLRFFERSLGASGDAEDLTQTVFVRLHRAARRYRPSAKFSSYLFAIARRLLLNELRRRRRKPASALEPEEFHLSDSAAEESRAHRETQEVLRRALAALPEKHRTAILLYVQQELTYAEIATSMKASESAVKTWIFRARQQLRSAFEQLENPNPNPVATPQA